MNNYVIYKGTGGLVHMLGGLVFSINYCIKYNNILIIDVISHTCYKHYLSDFFIIKNADSLIYSEDYNLIEPNILFGRKYTINDIKNYPNVELVNGKLTGNYQFYNFHIRHTLLPTNYKQKMKIYAGPGSNDHISIIKFIKVKSEIINKIKEFKEINNYIGVHFRNTDIQSDFNDFINKIKKYNYNNIYLATDDATAYNKFKLALPNHTIYQYTKPIEANGEPIHYAENNKYKLIFNLLVDIYFLYKADEFINTTISTVSRLTVAMRKEKKSIFDE
jgi:hypothetical protein